MLGRLELMTYTGRYNKDKSVLSTKNVDTKNKPSMQKGQCCKTKKEKIIYQMQFLQFLIYSKKEELLTGNDKNCLKKQTKIIVQLKSCD